MMGLVSATCWGDPGSRCGARCGALKPEPFQVRKSPRIGFRLAGVGVVAGSAQVGARRGVELDRRC